MAKLDDLLDGVQSLLGEVGTQNDLIASLPEISFKVKILWGVLCVVCATTLVGFLGWLGMLLLKSGGG